MPQLLRKSETLIFLFSLWVSISCNFAYWKVVAESNPSGGMPPLVFAANLALLTLGLISLVMLLLCIAKATRIVLAAALFASASAGYFTVKFGVLIDANMLINVLETNSAEAMELVSPSLLATLALLGLLPMVAVWKYPLTKRRLSMAVRDRSIALLVAICLIAGPLYFAQKEIVSFGRNHREVRHLIAPLNVISAGIILARDKLQRPAEFKQVGADAVHTRTVETSTRPYVHVLIVGETARSANFSLGGYSRATNPELRIRNDVHYLDAESCGTATAVSLPCMFTVSRRREFDRDASLNQDNLLDIAARSGYSVHWLDNGNGCKGLCARVDHRDVHLDAVDALCSANACFDEILVYELKNLLKKVSGDTLIVLHQLGSHGPAYYRRYPDRFRVFLPDCRSPNFGDCDDEQIANSYDNTILYTDHVISAAIDALAAESDHITPSLIYLSDHGESLGEHNLFLHGMPYKFAPAEQTHVPMITWFSAEAERMQGPLSDCADAQDRMPISHDNLFHTELGLLGIDTEIYDENMDLYSSCRIPRHASLVGADAASRT